MAQENNINKEEEYLNNWKRERADFINYKKDEAERTMNLVNFAKEKFVLKLLPVIDNIYLAQSHLKDDGLAQIIKQFEDFLVKEGVSVIETAGKQFDPNFHEVVNHTEKEGAQPEEIVQELQKGYMMGEKVLRPAKVVIAK